MNRQQKELALLEQLDAADAEAPANPGSEIPETFEDRSIEQLFEDAISANDIEARQTS